MIEDFDIHFSDDEFLDIIDFLDQEIDISKDSSDSSSLVNSEENPTNEEKQKKRKYTKKAKKKMNNLTEEELKALMTKPKILKNDPRRFYMKEYAAAYNSSDFDQVWNFMTDYSVREAVFIQRWSGEEDYLNFPRYLEIKGLENIVEYWFLRLMTVPDGVMTMLETKLLVRSNNTSMIKSSFELKGTRIYDSELTNDVICQDTAVSSSIERYPEANLKDLSDPFVSSCVYQRVKAKIEKILTNYNEHQQKYIPGPNVHNGKRKLDELVDDIKTDSLIAIHQGNQTGESEVGKKTKCFPKNKSVTFVGTVIFHLNEKNRIYLTDMTLKPKK